MALPALTVQRRTWDCLNLVLRYLILEDFRRKIIEVSLSPLLTHQGIMTAPVLNVLCHWDSGQFKQGEPDLEVKVCVSQGACLCSRQPTRERFAGLSVRGRRGAGPGWALHPGRPRPGLARALRAAPAWESPSGSGHEGTAGRGAEPRTHELLSASQMSHQKREKNPY